MRFLFLNLNPQIRFETIKHGKENDSRMRDKLKTLPLVQLRELAKAQGVKSVTTLKKAEIIEKLCELAESGRRR